jgi:hypothetical protein
MIPTDTTLTIPSGGTLSIPPERTLMNNGTIYVDHGAAIVGTVAGTQPVVPALTITGGASYTYTERVITITGSGTYTIGMKSGITKTTSDRIVVTSGVSADITLNGVNIDMSGQADAASFDMSDAAVNLTLTGTNILQSGFNRAGLLSSNGSTLVITAASTGSLTAIGGNYDAGIGGDYDAVIIGGGSYSDGGTITISGGTVTATADGGAGIGGGNNGGAGSIAALSGNAVVFASSIAPTLTAGTNATQAIAFNGTAGTIGTMYGSVTLQQDVTIPSTHTLDLSGGTLTIGGVTLTNDGTINKNGGTIVGTPAGRGTVND